MKFDVVIIGGGLGGLLCGNILSREGYNVCLLEKNNKLGGSLQTFGRKASIFNTGFNYAESLDEGQILHRYFRYFGILDIIKLKRLDEDGFDVISFKDGKYKLAMGHENFIDSLSRHFPGEKRGLNRYVQRLKSICSSIPLYCLSDRPFNIFEDTSLSIGAGDFIKSEISDYRLQNVIAGNNLMYAGHETKTPLLVHALISNSFIESAWRIVDGSHLMINFLAETITNNGGTIYKNSKAVKIIAENNRVKSVELVGGEQIEGKYFISNTHPEQLLSMVGSLKISSAFAYRIRNMEDTIGIFTMYIVFKKDSFPYLNYNLYHYNQDNTWVASDYDPSKWPQMYVLMSTATSASDFYARTASVLTYMSYNELLSWDNTFTSHRGDDYQQFKKVKCELLLKELEKQFPGITSCVETYYSSTPLTWRDYTGTRAGSAYGLMKDYNRPLNSFIMPKTKIPNLFLTGQNTNMHGILGVTIGAINTCGEILDISYLINQVRKT